MRTAAPLGKSMALRRNRPYADASSRNPEHGNSQAYTLARLKDEAS